MERTLGEFFLKYYEVKMAAILKSNMAAKDLEQLMGVFPAASGNFLPETWRELMISTASRLYV